MDQVWLFFAKAAEHRKTDVLSMSAGMRVAFHADRREWVAYAKSMGYKKPEKKITKDDMRNLKMMGARRNKGKVHGR